MAVISQPAVLFPRVFLPTPTTPTVKQNTWKLRSVELHRSLGRYKTRTLHLFHPETSTSSNQSLPFRRQDLLAPPRSPRGDQCATCRTLIATCRSVDEARASRRSFVVGVTAGKPLPRLIPNLARPDASTRQNPGSQVSCRSILDAVSGFKARVRILLLRISVKVYWGAALFLTFRIIFIFIIVIIIITFFLLFFFLRCFHQY